MKTEKQNADFLHVGDKLLAWYKIHGRDLPFRHTKDPYKIWICEIVFQQTRISQGLNHYKAFIGRFPHVQSLADAETDEVLLYWKGLGYYSRALNLQKAAKQIVEDFEGKFPENYGDILKLKGIGKYTAAAISSICFGKKLPAVDGNFYRVLSRLFGDGYDISGPKAFDHFAEIALQMIPENKAGQFNEAMMDLGSEICKPRNPLCEKCPLKSDCLAFKSAMIPYFPVKTKKIKPAEEELTYYFCKYGDHILIRRRNDGSIWKNLFEFPTQLPAQYEGFVTGKKTMKHKLTHKNLTLQIFHVGFESEEHFEAFGAAEGFSVSNKEDFHRKSFPKPLENYALEVFADKKIP